MANTRLTEITASAAARGGTPELNATELAGLLESGSAVQVLDVRAPQRLAAGRIETAPPAEFFNIPNSQLFALADPAATGLDRARPVVAVCGHGNSSLQTVAHLSRVGYQVASLQGGMAAWMQTLVPRELPAPPGFDRLVQFDRIGTGALGYLLISGSEALALDPPRNSAPYLAAAEESGARIAAVLDTHVHADYISGASALARQLGIPYYLHPADNVYPYDGTPGRLEFSPLSDGQELTIGSSGLTVEHTPGHTEGSVSVLAGDDAVFTGDFVFIKSLGRPDLAAKAAAWGRQLYSSLERARLRWPDSLRILPAHYASAAERQPDRSVWARLGELRHSNPALGISSAQELLDWVASRVSTPPPAYQLIKAINAGLSRVSDEEAEMLEGGKNECAVG